MLVRVRLVLASSLIVLSLLASAVAAVQWGHQDALYIATSVAAAADPITAAITKDLIVFKVESCSIILLSC